jgi:hypothetical protein
MHLPVNLGYGIKLLPSQTFRDERARARAYTVILGIIESDSGADNAEKRGESEMKSPFFDAISRVISISQLKVKN